MNNEKTSDFLVNLPLTDEELFNLKSIILDFITEKAESKVVSYYRPDARPVVAGGLMLKGSFKIEIPDKENFDKVLDLVKKANKKEPDERTRTVVTIFLPIISIPTGKND